MDKNIKKVYRFPFIIGAIIIYGIITIGLIVLTAILVGEVWLVLLVCLVFISLFIYWLVLGVNPIRITPEEIISKKDKILWVDVEIAICPFNFIIGRAPACCILFADKYDLDKHSIKEQKRKGFYVLLTNKTLDIILTYYKKEIRFLDKFGYPSCANVSKKIKSQIDKHNKNYCNIILES